MCSQVYILWWNIFFYYCFGSFSSTLSGFGSWSRHSRLPSSRSSGGDPEVFPGHREREHPSSVSSFSLGPTPSGMCLDTSSGRRPAGSGTDARVTSAASLHVKEKRLYSDLLTLSFTLISTILFPRPFLVILVMTKIS